MRASTKKDTKARFEIDLGRLRIMGMLKMKNLQLTKWLQLVWDALAEPDEVKRNKILQSAGVFLKELSIVFVQREMERGRSPLVSIPP